MGITLRAACAAALCLAAASAAQAASLSYDFTVAGTPAVNNGSAKQTDWTFVNNGVTVGVTAQYTTDLSRTVWTSTNAFVYRTDANGLGVTSVSDANNAMIDAVESNERLLFNFSEDVTVLSISFKNSGTNDKAQVGLFDGTTNQQLGSFLLGNSVFTQTMSIGVPDGNFFYLEAIPSGGAPSLATDWFSVSAMTAQTGISVAGPAAAVPLPAAMWAGLPVLGLAMVKRRLSKRA
jgi:hypothetical protein